MSKNRKQDLEKYSRMFGALSNPHRLKIFLELVHCCVDDCEYDSESGARTCVGDLGCGLDISASTISHHLKELKDSGLIRMHRRGQKVECYIEPDVIEDLVCFFINTPQLREKIKLTSKK